MRAEHAGEAGLRWLDELPHLVTAIETQWSIVVGEPLPNANEGYVARVKRADGTDAVVKLLVPMPWMNNQIDTLERAAGHGYARVLASDHMRQALLMEALGQPLDEQGLPLNAMLDTLVTTLREAWKVRPPTRPDFQTGATKAQGLRTLIADNWEKLDRPCSAEAVDLALRFLDRREAAFAPEHSVWGHGDPHAGNALQVPHRRRGAESGYAFVDPEGLLIEPAYDLGVILRDWDTELAHARDPLALAHRIGSRLADSTGTDGQAVWEWGFIERVATGLYVLDHGIAWGHDKLANAERLLPTR
ncbi:aminoglycoside phosphotransferase family protein [Glycomyces rhizosphaerae]|uniref:Aminoglycoside phosphotransferase family protein n=1 Tax=Glycomyces rhizosphaerae TaxID=2054422 RepID=A0ABV7Q2A1_9ACTN